VTTLEVGTFQAKEVRKECRADRSHPVIVFERLARLVPHGQGYGYDLIVQVGLARYLRNLQREEIRAELLRENGIVVSEGTITNLCDRFLQYLERIEKTVSLFGDPIAVVRDLSAAEAGAVDSLRDKGIPDLVCHYPRRHRQEAG
jgi:hypothetical protein